MKKILHNKKNKPERNINPNAFGKGSVYNLGDDITHLSNNRDCSNLQCSDIESHPMGDLDACWDYWGSGWYCGQFDENWYDPYSNSCDWYGADFDRCIAVNYEYDMNCGLTAWEACCECNGGTKQMTNLNTTPGNWPEEVRYTVYNECGQPLLTADGDDYTGSIVLIPGLDINNMAVCICDSYGDGLNGFHLDFWNSSTGESQVFGDHYDTWGTLESGTPFSCNCHTVGNGICGPNCPMKPKPGQREYTCLNTGKHNGGNSYAFWEYEEGHGGHDNMHCSGLPADWVSDWSSWFNENCPYYSDSGDLPVDCDNYDVFSNSYHGCFTPMGQFPDGSRTAMLGHNCPRQCWIGCDSDGYYPAGPQCSFSSQNVDFRQTGWAAGYGSITGVANHCGRSGDDGYWSKCEVVKGCTDPVCDNYNPLANIDDGTCSPNRDCFGVCGGSSVIDECGECGGPGLYGWTCDCSNIPEYGNRLITINGVNFIAEDGYCNCHGGVTDGCGDCVCTTTDNNTPSDCGTWAGRNWFTIDCNDDNLYVGTGDDRVPRPDVLNGTFDAFCGCPGADGQPRCQSDGIGGLECLLPDENPQAYCWHKDASNCQVDTAGGSPIDWTDTVSATYSDCINCGKICLGATFKDDDIDDCLSGIHLEGDLPCDETEWSMTHCVFEVACANPDYNGYDCRCAPGGAYYPGTCYAPDDSISACGTYLGSNLGLEGCPGTSDPWTWIGLPAASCNDIIQVVDLSQWNACGAPGGGELCSGGSAQLGEYCPEAPNTAIRPTGWTGSYYGGSDVQLPYCNRYYACGLNSATNQYNCVYSPYDINCNKCDVDFNWDCDGNMLNQIEDGTIREESQPDVMPIPPVKDPNINIGQYKDGGKVTKELPVNVNGEIQYKQNGRIFTISRDKKLKRDL